MKTLRVTIVRTTVERKSFDIEVGDDVAPVILDHEKTASGQLWAQQQAAVAAGTWEKDFFNTPTFAVEKIEVQL